MSNLLKDKKLLTILFLSLFFRILFFLIYSPWKEEVEKTLVLNGDAVQYQQQVLQIMYSERQSILDL